MTKQLHTWTIQSIVCCRRIPATDTIHFSYTLFSLRWEVNNLFIMNYLLLFRGEITKEGNRHNMGIIFFFFFSFLTSLFI